MFRLVQRLQNLVSSVGNRTCIRYAPFDFDEAELARSWNAALDVVPELLRFSVDRLKAQRTFDLHDGRTGSSSGCLGVDCMTLLRKAPSGDGSEESRADHEHSADHDRRQRRYSLLFIKSPTPVLKPRLQLVGTPPRLTRIEPRSRLARLFLGLQFSGTMVPIGDLFLKPIVNGSACPFNQLGLPGSYFVKVFRHHAFNSVSVRRLFKVF